MKKTRKFLCILLALSFIFALSACGAKEAAAPAASNAEAPAAVEEEKTVEARSLRFNVLLSEGTLGCHLQS